MGEISQQSFGVWVYDKEYTGFLGSKMVDAQLFSKRAINWATMGLTLLRVASC